MKWSEWMMKQLSECWEGIYLNLFGGSIRQTAAYLKKQNQTKAPD